MKSQDGSCLHLNVHLRVCRHIPFGSIRIHRYTIFLYAVYIQKSLEVHVCIKPFLNAHTHMCTDSTISSPFSSQHFTRYFLVDGASVDDRPVWCKPAVQMKALGSRATDVYLIYCSLAAGLNKGDSFMVISRYLLVDSLHQICRMNWMHMFMIEVRSGQGRVTVSLMIRTGSIYHQKSGRVTMRSSEIK